MENLVSARPDPTFWRGRRVLLTGHTGFKGAWASLWLEAMGAEVTALALAPEGEPKLYRLFEPFERHTSLIGDIRDPESVRAAIGKAKASVALHLAAQPLVRRAYRYPAETFAVNVQGTVHVLEALRGVGGLQAVLCVTTDKVYRNQGEGRPFTEDDPLGGEDPYSASKAAAELVIASWGKTVFEPAGIALASARAGNVIGGGDVGEDRLVPDLWRAAQAGRAAALRHPQATRPWQHVLDTLAGYFLYLEHLVRAPDGLPRALNFGPDPAEAAPVAVLAERLAARLGAPAWIGDPGPHPSEQPHLALDSRRAHDVLGWRPRLSPLEAIDWTADWLMDVAGGANARVLTLAQIARHQA